MAGNTKTSNTGTGRAETGRAETSNTETGSAERTPLKTSGRTPRTRSLGKALRAAREESGLSLRKLSIDMGRDPGALSRWETGDRTPKSTDVAQILTLLGINGDRYDEIIGLTRGTDDARWEARLPEQRQQLATLLDFERTATTIIEVSPLLVPGLLQTNDYARAIMTAGSVPQHEVETRVAVRLGRRDVITRRDPARLLALVGEAALRQLVGGPEVMVDQLRYLLHTAELTNVDIHIVPFLSGWHPALEGPFTLIDSARNASVVHLENRRSGLFFQEAPDVETYREAVNAVTEKAMNENDSTAFIARIAKETGS